MNFFMATYYLSHRGSYTEKHYVVVAETEGVALGLLLEAEQETSAKDWEISPIERDTAGAHYVHSHEV